MTLRTKAAIVPAASGRATLLARSPIVSNLDGSARSSLKIDSTLSPLASASTTKIAAPADSSACALRL